MIKVFNKRIMAYFFCIFSVIIFWGCGFAISNNEMYENAVSTSKSHEKEMINMKKVKEDKNLSVEKMVKYALQNEYEKRDTYKFLVDRFINEKAFDEIYNNKKVSVSIIEAFANKQGVKIEKDKANKNINIYSNIKETKTAMRDSELENIIIYNTFINQKEVPQELILVFSRIKEISKMNLNLLKQ